MSDSDQIPVLNAATMPDARQRLELVVGAMRAGLAPLLNQHAGADGDQFAMDQSLIISGAALLAGMTVGHMTFFGTMKPHDRRRAEKVVAVNFRNGIKLGLDEAKRAMADAGQVN